MPHVRYFRPISLVPENAIVGSMMLSTVLASFAMFTIFVRLSYMFPVSNAIDRSGEHANLYERALNDLIAQRSIEYYVCTVCGHIAERQPPETCPICGAAGSKFEKVL